MSELNFGLDDAPKQITNLLKPEDIVIVKSGIRKNDPYPMEETRTRNIIMLGRSGSGKTTAINVIKDICAQSQPRSLFSDTYGAKFQSFSLDDKKSKTKYTLNIIDTPGVNDIRPMGEDSRSDEAILETVKFCLKNEITRVHCLFIFAAFGERINELDKKAFKIYLQMFDNDKIKIAFCITKSEGQSKEDCENIIKQLEKETYFANIIKKQNVKVFFTGCVNKFMLENSKDKQTLADHYKDIHKRREEMIKYIFDSGEEGVRLLDLPIIGTSIKSMKDIFEIQNGIISKFEQTTDFKTGIAQENIVLFNQNIQYMMENEGLFTNKDLHQAFIDLKRRMLGLKNKMDADTWLSFSIKVVLN